MCENSFFFVGIFKSNSNNIKIIHIIIQTDFSVILVEPKFNVKLPFIFFSFIGIRYAPQLSHAPHKTDKTVAASEAPAKNGQILPVQRHDPDTSHALLHSGGPLVGLHLVRHSREGDGHGSGWVLSEIKRNKDISYRLWNRGSAWYRNVNTNRYIPEGNPFGWIKKKGILGTIDKVWLGKFPPTFCLHFTSWHQIKDISLPTNFWSSISHGKCYPL